VAFSAEFSVQNKQDERIVIPKLAITILKDGKPNLDNHVAEVRLDPL
jgi:hypothetical protein